jgi:hypothetical protein
MSAHLTAVYVSAMNYDAFGNIGAIFRELEWSMLIFYGIIVPKTLNASYHR